MNVSVKSVVEQIKNQYSDGTMFGGNALNLTAGSNTVSNGFYGSNHTIFITAGDSISIRAPGCAAADSINFVAKNAIKLGVEGQGEQPVPVRIFAPSQLTMSADEISIGAVQFVVKGPDFALLTCRKLHLYNTTGSDEEPKNFEVIRSWVPDYTEVIYHSNN